MSHDQCGDQLVPSCRAQPLCRLLCRGLGVRIPLRIGDNGRRWDVIPLCNDPIPSKSDARIMGTGPLTSPSRSCPDAVKVAQKEVMIHRLGANMVPTFERVRLESSVSRLPTTTALRSMTAIIAYTNPVQGQISARVTGPPRFNRTRKGGKRSGRLNRLVGSSSKFEGDGCHPFLTPM